MLHVTYVRCTNIEFDYIDDMDGIYDDEIYDISDIYDLSDSDSLSFSDNDNDEERGRRRRRGAHCRRRDNSIDKYFCRRYGIQKHRRRSDLILHNQGEAL